VPGAVDSREKMTNHQAASLFLEAGRDFLAWVEYLDPAEVEAFLKCARTVRELRNVALHRKQHETA
jgi:hypothetical protein